MGQSLVGDFTGHICVAQEINRSLGFLRAALAEGQGDRPFVAVVKSREELLRWLREPSSDVQWLQVEGVIGDADAWAAAAQGDIDVPVDGSQHRRLSSRTSTDWSMCA